MKKDPFEYTSRKPQFLQQDTMSGYHKGFVVDVRDPLQQGRVRVHCYGLHADYKGIDIDTLPWADSVLPYGTFAPPELWSPVWVSFDSADKYSPTYVGCWNHIPDGSGKLPFNKKTGTTIRPEGFGQNDLYPENQVVASSGEGCTIWFSNQLLEKDKNLNSSINIMDTGGRFIKIYSLHVEERDFVQDHKIQDNLDNASYEENKAVRDGYSKIKESLGGIDLGFKNLEISFNSDEDDKTHFIISQSIDKKVALEIQSVGGEIFSVNMGKTSLLMDDESISLQAMSGVMINKCFTTPMRWDK